MGTTAGTVWYVNWQGKSSVKLVSGHAEQVGVGLIDWGELLDWSHSPLSLFQVTGVAFSDDGSHFASSCRDGSLAVWSAESLEQTVLFQAPRKVCEGVHACMQ